MAAAEFRASGLSKDLNRAEKEVESLKLQITELSLGQNKTTREH